MGKRRRALGRIPMDGVLRLRYGGGPHSLKTRYKRAKFKLRDYEPEPQQTCEFCEAPSHTLILSDNGWLICPDCEELRNNLKLLNTEE